jgi:hypothetical protein
MFGTVEVLGGRFLPSITLVVIKVLIRPSLI